MNKGKIRVSTIIYFIAIIIIIWIGFSIYSKYNFNDFVKGIREDGKTLFSRDAEVKYSKLNSYKIENKDFNDAMFYKNIEVTPNTAYRVTCMVKTENVENKEGKYTGGAQISINETTICSEAITGTNDWTKLTLMFNSNSNTNIEIGFRLGGFEEFSKGTAWFSDFIIEEGMVDSDNTWNVACFIIDNIEANITEGNKRGSVNLNVSYDDIKTVKSNMKRFQSSIKELSNDKISVNYDIIEITDTLETLSYDEENGYYVTEKDVEPLIENYIERQEYDYIFVVVQLGNLNDSAVNIHNWIGLRCNEV